MTGISQTMSNTFKECECCPYGYHMDLDFVSYCEALEHVNTTLSKEQNQRRFRRRQRKSIEVLLGLDDEINYQNYIFPNLNPVVYEVDEHNSENNEIQCEIKSRIINEALNDVCSDFENTLKNHRVSPKMYSNFKIEDIDPELMRLPNKNTQALHAIREQMAESLRRTKYLEQQTKLVPLLQVCAIFF